MAGPQDVLLARHGETDDNAAGRFQGRRDPPLNERGREQARALAELLTGEGLVALYSSPLRRARQTAEIVAERLGLALAVDERFVEADVGDWAGLRYADAAARDPAGVEAWRVADPAFRFPNGESVTEQTSRVAAALAAVRDGPLPAAVVCHGGTIRAAMGPRTDGGQIPNGSVHVAPPAAGTVAR